MHVLLKQHAVMLLQLTLCAQTPETTMTSALASINFYIGQIELQAQLRESQLQRKLEKVQEACKKKLQEVHNGYTQVGCSEDSPVLQLARFLSTLSLYCPYMILQLFHMSHDVSIHEIHNLKVILRHFL